MIPRLALCWLGLAFAAAAPAQETRTVYRNVSSATLEHTLQDLKIQFKKTPGNKAGIFFYDYTHNGFKMRLHNYAGTDLWIEALFTDRLPLEEINRWNIRAKFSRCVLLRTADKTTLSLENQLDCRGGCTDAIVRQFINRFDHEVTSFADFIKNAMPR